MFADQKFPPEFDPLGIAQRATYLAPLLLAQSPAIVNPDINWYVPGPTRPNIEQCQNLADVPSRGFRSRYMWDKDGKKTEGVPARPAISTLDNARHHSRPRQHGRRSPELFATIRPADGTRPHGTIYFMWNKDVRSFARDKCFPAVAAQINAAGGHAVVQQGRIPTGAKDVAGMMVGTAEFNLAKEGVKILPGAICDHLTSEGGIIAPERSQTPLSEFLRHALPVRAARSSNPCLQAKFPLPSLQLHYVRGCSLAEAFYQSVSGPYQLLIVGDPLCQPWATFPKIAVTGVKPDEKVKGTLSLTPSGPSSIGTYELYVDGRLTARAAPGSPLATRYHQTCRRLPRARIVGIRSDPIETQGRTIVPIFVNNHDAAVEIKVAPATLIPLSAKIQDQRPSTGATRSQFDRTVATWAA